MNTVKAQNSVLSAIDVERARTNVEKIMSQNERMDRLDGWFIAREIMMDRMKSLPENIPAAAAQAELLYAVAEKLPIRIRDGEIFAGGESDSFARSYALINPSFKVETFEGYCDEDAVYADIEPNGEFTPERIASVRDFWADRPYAKALKAVYERTGAETREVVYFVERVTGHTIPDFRPAISRGVVELIDEIKKRAAESRDRAEYYSSMAKSLEAAIVLARRYSELARDMASNELDTMRAAELRLIAETCARVPALGARNLYEAMQSYIILWQVMNLEQSPNPFAFSAGNLDVVFQPYLDELRVSDKFAVQLTRHFLATFCVGDRNWAISQNIMVGGRDEDGRDLTNDMSRIFIKAFADFNYSQPNLSVRLSPSTPDSLYENISEFMFDFGRSTPSFFNDQVMFKMFEGKGIARADMPMYGIAGCQEPLIMGKESGNTTNSWLNLAKILELTLSGGVSALTGARLAPCPADVGISADYLSSASGIKDAFHKYLDYFLPRMQRAANDCTDALAMQPVPFHSAFMGGIESGADMRDTVARGTAYNGSGCLIHGMANVADSFNAIEHVELHGAKYGFTIGDVLEALKNNFSESPELRDFLLSKPPKFGNGDAGADAAAVELVSTVNKKVNSLKNSFGNNFCADWSTPSTNLLYGYHTGATPDGRSARAPLAYGVDPAVSAASRGLLSRVKSQSALDYSGMTGGSASAMSINPENVKNMSPAEKSRYLKEIMSFIFDFNGGRDGKDGLMYVYFNVYSQEQLKHVMEHPEEYPNPVIVRIHGQYGDARHLSPDVLGMDIIPKLDPLSTSF